MTTGQAAKLMNCSQQSIIRAFDTGIIKGHRIPGSKFRRIHTQDLLTYMKNNGIPIPEEQPA